MNSKERDFWERATGMLGQDGPALVPDDLAERAFRKALHAEPRSESLFDALLPFARWAAPCLMAAAFFLLLIPEFKTTEKTNSVIAAWEMSTGPVSEKAVAAKILATPSEINEVKQ